jgi:hypothetical protein
VLINSLVSVGQQVKHPEVGDPELYIIALQLVKNFEDKATLEPNLERKRDIRFALMQDAKLDETDYSIVVSQALQLHDSLISAATSKQRKGTARIDAVNHTLKYLSTHLSAAGWQKFNSFVNGPVRETTTVVVGSGEEK